MYILIVIFRVLEFLINPDNCEHLIHELVEQFIFSRATMLVECVCDTCVIFNAQEVLAILIVCKRVWKFQCLSCRLFRFSRETCYAIQEICDDGSELRFNIYMFY
jgi:hypothetical protein